MAITNNHGEEIARFVRPFKPQVRCGLIYSPLFLQKMGMSKTCISIQTYIQNLEEILIFDNYL